MQMTLKEKMEKVKDLRPIDDVFFEVLAARTDVCQEIISTILEDPDLIVEDVIVQGSERNLYGKSVRLDALVTLGNGKKVNVEVQRSDNDDHLRRVRFNAASITVRESQAGDDYSKLPDVIVIYISEFDFLKGGKTTYHVDRVLRETGRVIDDGQSEIFVNTRVDDHTKIAELMDLFKRPMFENESFPALSEAVKEIKTTEGGTGVMCEVMQKYEAIAMEKGIEKGIEQGIEKGRMDLLVSLCRKGIITLKEAAEEAMMSEQEFAALAAR